MKNLYLEKLKRMDGQTLMDECNATGKIMERKEPMTYDEKFRALLCFKYAIARSDFSEEDKDMLRTAVRVMRLL